MAETKILASVVILTKNEERHVRRAVRSAISFDEVLVVDSNSEDLTVEKALQEGALTLRFDWNGQYPKKKEWSLQHVSHNWVFYLDADEFFTEALVEEIREIVERNVHSAVEVPLTYFWLGRELRHGHKVSKRIGIKTSACSWPRPDDLHVKNMWEVEGHYQPIVENGACFYANSELGHQDEDGLFDYFARHNRYSDWEAHMLEEKDEASLASRSRLGRIAANLPAKPIVFFCYSYVLKRGFLDGREGLHYALALSFYYWQIQIKRVEIARAPGSAR